MENENQKLHMNKLEQAAGGMDTVDLPRIHGIFCPNCHEFIQFTGEQIKDANYLECPHCGFKLTIAQNPHY